MLFPFYQYMYQATNNLWILPSPTCFAPPTSPPPTHPLCPPTTYAGHHYLSHLKRAKYMYKPYALVRGSTQKCLQLIHVDEQKEGRKKGVKMYIFVPVCYKSFNASCILKLKICTCLLNLQSGPILAALISCYSMWLLNV